MTTDIKKQKKTVKKQGISKQTFFEVFNLSPAPIAITSMEDGCFIDVNKSFLQTLGFKKKGVIGFTSKELNIFVDYRDRQRIIDGIEKNGKISDLEINIRDREGNIHSCLFSAGIIVIGGKKCLITIITDVTEIKKTETTLKQFTHQLDERIKELNCLHEISNLMQDESLSLEELLNKTAYIIPTGYQFPDIASCRIVINGNEFKTKDFLKTQWSQKTDIIVFRKVAGFIEVCYKKDIADRTEKIFLYEENALLRDVAERVGKIIEKKRVESDLIERENEYRSIFNDAVEGIFQITPEGRYIKANLAHAKLYGYSSPEEMIEDISTLYVNPEKTKEFTEKLNNEGMIEKFETEFYRKDGSTVWVSINARTVRDNKGDVLYYEGTAEDMTSRKKTEKLLNYEKEKFSTLIENAPFGMALIDKDGNFLYINPKFTEIFGYELADVPDGETWFRKAYPDPEYRHMVIKTWLEDINGSKFGEQRPRIFNVICKDGTEKIISFIPVQLESGTEIVSFEDITIRKKTEEALQKAEQKYRSIFENATEGIFQTTPEGRYISVNPSFARMFGFDSPQDMIDTVTNIGEQLYVHPEDRERIKQLLIEKGFANSYEVELYRKDKSRFWVSINVRGVFDADGKLLYLEGTNQDITSRKLAQQSLEEAMHKLRHSLAGTIKIISMIIEARDPYTAGHQRRVSNLARAIAQEMGLPPDTIANIRMAGSIHDIGKISVPAEILSKPGRLSDLEMGIIMAHPQSGYNILKNAELPYPIAEIVLQHHERLDGSGYPKGLIKDEILLESKIITVADVVEAVSSNRPYRPANGLDFALDEITKNKGILYDERVVEICLMLFREKGYALD